jgi:SRSO17 transposase
MFDMGTAVVGRLQQFLDGIGELLGNDSRRASFATYAMGLLSEGERKSVEPIAARACPDPQRVDAEHQRLLHFIGLADWEDRHVRRHAARYALEAMTTREAVQAWILDDTGFLKQGKHSVGVQRQYTGSAGKITNCQVGVSLTISTETEHLPIDFELYLPRSWTQDAARRREARIPNDIEFKTKGELALEMVRRALDDDVPRGVVLADAGYGTSSNFRHQLQGLGLPFSLGVEGNTKVFEIGEVVTRGGAAVSLRKLAKKLMDKGEFQRCTWREGTRNELTANFALRRVLPCKDSRRKSAPPPTALWLLIEWRDGEDAPANYFFSNLPDTTSLLELVRITMQRWRIERTYEDLKGELGLDHYEGRGFRGWHHHISVVLCCYAFLVSERVRHFPPSIAGTPGNATDEAAA